MRIKLLLLAVATALLAITARADFKETTIDWEPACDGATIDIISQGQTIVGVRAIAFHSYVINEWSIHYLDGVPVTAEYRVRKRGRITEGDHAGEFSGVNPLKVLNTYRATGGKFKVADEKMAKELDGILRAAKNTAKAKPAR